MRIIPEATTGRLSQGERRSRTRKALLESAARNLSRHGYANLALSRVSQEAGYTRGALYHLFDNKEALALAVVEWVEETWDAEVRQPARELDDPVESLLAIARGHAIYCRRDVARVLMTLSIEFSNQDSPIGRALDDVIQRLLADTQRWISAGRDTGAIPPGPPVADTALAVVGALQGVMISTAGREPADVILVQRAVSGILGLPPRG